MERSDKSFGWSDYDRLVRSGNLTENGVVYEDCLGVDGLTFILIDTGISMEKINQAGEELARFHNPCAVVVAQIKEEEVTWMGSAIAEIMGFDPQFARGEGNGYGNLLHQ